MASTGKVTILPGVAREGFQKLMTCVYCGSRNAEGEHRCGRCGRTAADSLNSGPVLSRGAVALAAEPELAPVRKPEPPQPVVVPARGARALPVQGSLFPDRAGLKVVPLQPSPRTRSARGARQPARGAAGAPQQTSLDFLPAVPKPRTLGTTVEASIFCEAQVASPRHRLFAATIDAAIVMIGYAMFLTVFWRMGGTYTWDKLHNIVFLGAFGLLVFAYGLVWVVANGPTAGMRSAGLRLTTFDGFPPDQKQRILRFAGSCVGIPIVLGAAWAVVDEEKLAWQDHMSRTFPTARETDSPIMRRR